MATSYTSSSFKLGPLKLKLDIYIQAHPWQDGEDKIVRTLTEVFVDVRLFAWRKVLTVPKITMHYKPEYSVAITKVEDTYIQVGNNTVPSTKSRKDLLQALNVDVNDPPATVADVYGEQK